MFRPGTKNGHTVYWSPNTGPDRFVCTAMSGLAARTIAAALNRMPLPNLTELLVSLPQIPKRGQP